MTQHNIIENSLREIPHDKLERLLDIYGIGSEFIDFSGNLIKTPLKDRLSVLAAMGVSLKNQAEVNYLLELKSSSTWLKWLQAVISLQLGQCVMPLVCHDEEVNVRMFWNITLEDGAKLAGDFRPGEFPVKESYQSGGRFFSARDIPLPNLPSGYHHIRLDNGEKAVSSLIIVAPSRTYQPEWLLEEKRIWGVSAQLYALTTERNWGIGDFSDLRQLIELTVVQGADFILLNPLHALDIKYPENASPYSPADRRFLNPLYIDPSTEMDFLNSTEVQMLTEQPGFKNSLSQLRTSMAVDYSAVFALKYKVFDLMYQHFHDQHLAVGTASSKQFEKFVSIHGETILTFANFQADITLPGIPSGHDFNFHLYLQWLAAQQLASCQDLAIEKGMKIGLIRDLAVGGNSESCEVISNPDLFCMQARIGAPPDNFNPDGQNWGLPPIRPDMLEKTQFAHFISLLKENMHSCGALRIDHVMALMRLWWSPAEGSGNSGAYVYYPVHELFAILRLESQRAQCMIIGEDLGVVPPEIRPFLEESGVLSNVVFYFEKYDDGHFKKAAHYPKRALANVANHDVPTLKAWWNTDDLRLRRKLGLIVSDEQLQDDLEFRQHEKRQLLYWLEDAFMLPEEWWGKDIEKPFDVSLCSAIFRGCASSNSLMVSVQLDDIAGLDSPVNIPGTSTEYSNWRRKIPVTTQQLFASAEVGQILTGIQQER
tara:strand:- start:60218 stop:62347 length:2130 start_codon:yes stop_codon:yes gene_type:complete